MVKHLGIEADGSRDAVESADGCLSLGPRLGHPLWIDNIRLNHKAGGIFRFKARCKADVVVLLCSQPSDAEKVGKDEQDEFEESMHRAQYELVFGSHRNTRVLIRKRGVERAALKKNLHPGYLLSGPASNINNNAILAKSKSVPSPGSGFNGEPPLNSIGGSDNALDRSASSTSFASSPQHHRLSSASASSGGSINTREKHLREWLFLDYWCAFKCGNFAMGVGKAPGYNTLLYWYDDDFIPCSIVGVSCWDQPVVFYHMEMIPLTDTLEFFFQSSRRTGSCEFFERIRYLREKSQLLDMELVPDREFLEAGIPAHSEFISAFSQPLLELMKRAAPMEETDIHQHVGRRRVMMPGASLVDCERLVNILYGKLVELPNRESVESLNRICQYLQLPFLSLLLDSGLRNHKFELRPFGLCILDLIERDAEVMWDIGRHKFSFVLHRHLNILLVCRDLADLRVHPGKHNKTDGDDESMMIDTYVLAHRSVLAARNDFFLAMFTGGMKESGQSDIQLDCSSSEICAAILQFVYLADQPLATEKHFSFTWHDFLEIVRLADLMGIMALRLWASRSLAEMLTCENVAHLSNEALTVGIYDLFDACCSFVVEQLISKPPQGFKDLMLMDKALVLSVLSRDDACCAEETCVLDFLLQWVLSDAEDVQALLDSDLSAENEKERCESVTAVDATMAEQQVVDSLEAGPLAVWQRSEQHAVINSPVFIWALEHASNGKFSRAHGSSLYRSIVNEISEVFLCVRFDFIGSLSWQQFVSLNSSHLQRYPWICDALVRAMTRIKEEEENLVLMTSPMIGSPVKPLSIQQPSASQSPGNKDEDSCLGSPSKSQVSDPSSAQYFHATYSATGSKWLHVLPLHWVPEIFRDSQNVETNLLQVCQRRTRYKQNASELSIPYVPSADQRGVLNYLAYSVLPGVWMNPVHQKVIRIESSSRGHFSAEKLVSFQAADQSLNMDNFCSSDSSGFAWIEIQLGDNFELCCHCYLLAHDCSASNFIRNWVLEAHDLSQQTWDVISRHVNDRSMNFPSQRSVWRVNNPSARGKYYQKFRLRSLDPHAKLVLGGIEMFGRLRSLV